MAKFVKKVNILVHIFLPPAALQYCCLKKNPKSEYRNPKQIQMPKIKMTKTKKN